MKYIVTDQFSGGAGWTADKLARALKRPLAAVGVTVERIAGHSNGGFEATALDLKAHKQKFDEVGAIVRRVLQGDPPQD